MGAPTKQELEQAIAEATRMHDRGDDPHHIAKALLNLDQRVHRLEKVLSAAKHYLHSGLGEHEHSDLVLAIEAAEKAAEPCGTTHETLGLD
jgi:hypothetical protein